MYVHWSLIRIQHSRLTAKPTLPYNIDMWGVIIQQVTMTAWLLDYLPYAKELDSIVRPTYSTPGTPMVLLLKRRIAPVNSRVGTVDSHENTDTGFFVSCVSLYVAV